MAALLFGLIGTFLGGAISIVTTWLTQTSISKREAEQWERQHAADREKLERERSAQTEQELRRLYAECMLHLAAIHTLSEMRDRNEAPGEEEKNHVIATQRSLAELLTHVDPQKEGYLESTVEAFLHGSNVMSPRLLGVIIHLLRVDSRLSWAPVDVPDAV